MLSSSDLETLIAVKKHEIENEKAQLGLSPQRDTAFIEDDKENVESPSKRQKQVNFASKKVLCERNDVTDEKKEKADTRQDIEDIPTDLERYIRRYLGLPVMLKAGEYSPNNPLIRDERDAAPGDALFGLGEYERQRNTLRRIRQQQYREYLDQQAKKKQEAKEQAERERREREEREREWEERQRELLIERDKRPEHRRDLDHVSHTSTVYSNNKVDTGVQVDGFSQPLSVAVQTDNELYRLSPSPSKSQLTEAERELSPRTVHEPTKAGWNSRDSWPTPCERRRSYGDYDERSSLMKKCNSDKLAADLRHTYMPSIFDADAIQLRNQQAEKEAAERRRYYQQELKNQILEQQRIREERKSREKMLEQAEMRRLEEQLRMLRAAQECEISRQRDVTSAMKENALEYNTKRTELQREIDSEQQKLLRVKSQPKKHSKRITNETKTPRLPLYCSKPQTHDEKKPYSMNIPDNSIFSANYDVDAYLRRNLNFNKDTIFKKADYSQEKKTEVSAENIIRPNDTEPSVDKSEIPPVLKHTPVSQDAASSDLSDKMKIVDDKWKVPVVQKNILTTVPDNAGKSVSILTQLGSIRRQLQLEQLKLDNMV